MDGTRKDIDANAVAPEAPAWVTESLIAMTFKVWQPYYKNPLSRGDVIRMIISVGQLFRVVAQGRGYQGRGS
ncbi:MAG: hypothetical protein C0478_06045 [Planctomyces sp.]|nr:hypothetical protein [Planctomyces sp.]